MCCARSAFNGTWWISCQPVENILKMKINGIDKED